MPDPVKANLTLSKNVALVQARARYFRLLGKAGSGRQLVESAIRQGSWLKSKLWWEMVSLMGAPEDYASIRALWLTSPTQVHKNLSIQRAVARAAAVAGAHEDCRTLLRRLILKAKSAAAGKLKTASSPTANSSSMNRFASHAATALKDLNEAFSEIGLRSFLISGTLLGQVRQGGIIGWDKDIDVGFFTEECHIDLGVRFMRHPKFRIGRVDLTSDRLRLIHGNGMWIDVFPHYMDGGKRWHNGTATRWWNTPFELREIEFLGINQYIPDNPELYLDENYGDWRTPNSNFDARIDAPNAEISDPEHFISLLYFGLEKSIRDGKQTMQKRYIELLRSKNEGAWLDRL